MDGRGNSYCFTVDGEMTDEKMAALFAFSEHAQFVWWEDAKALADELSVTLSCAADVLYLRSLPRWTQEVETELIRLHSAGTPPNILEWPPEGMFESDKELIYEPHQLRVIEEERELSARLAKLTAFLGTDKFQALRYVDQMLLNRQHDVMTQYQVILRARIDIFQ